MEKQFTIEHYNHIKESGFNPQICHECQEIGYILNKIAIYGSAAPELYEALKELSDYLYVLGGDEKVIPQEIYQKIKAKYTRGYEALAKAEGGK